MRLPLPLLIALAVAVPVLLGGVALSLFTAAHLNRPQPTVERVWTPPAHLGDWQEYELTAVNKPTRGGWQKIGIPEQFLVMRCRGNHQRQLWRKYWPGAGGWGSEHIVWIAGKVTYLPKGFGSVTAKQHAFTLAGVRENLPCP